MNKKELEEKLEIKTILLRVFVIMFIFESLAIMFAVALINDKTNLIMEYKNEKEKRLTEFEGLLQKNVKLNKEVNEYKRVCGDIDG